MAIFRIEKKMHVIKQCHPIVYILEHLSNVTVNLYEVQDDKSTKLESDVQYGHAR